MTQPVHNLFERMRQTLSDESKWLPTTGWAVDSLGIACLPHGYDAVKWSIMGVLHLAHTAFGDTRSFRILYTAFNRVITAEFPDRFSDPNRTVTDFNAHPLTTWDDVQEVFNRVAQCLGIVSSVMTFSHDTDSIPLG